MSTNDFKVHIPVSLIKGKDSKGNSVMKMRGVASTPSKDSDEEYLEPKGFESDYFLKYGFMNWNHQTNNDPSAIVGRPTSANVDGDNYIIDFNLFPESKKAQEIYELQRVLESQGLALGLSIEGKVIERDPKNNAIVKKARITGCAITPNPKNQDTVAQIIKGNSFSSLSAYDDTDEEQREKAMSAGSASGQAISKESLDGDLKRDKDVPKTKNLKKSEVIEKISRDLPHLKKETIESVYNLTEKIQKSIDMSDKKQTKDNTPNISEEALEKAYAILEIAQKETEKDEVVKGEETAEIERREEVEKGEVLKADSKKVADMTPEERSEFKAFLQKGLNELTALEAIAEAEAEEDLKKGEDAAEEEEEEEEEIEKKEDKVEKAQKSDEIAGTAKPNEELLKSLTDLFKGEVNSIREESSQKLAAVGRILKGITDQVEGFSGRLEQMENFNPGPKSVQTKKQHVIEKSFATNELEDAPKTTTFSAKKNRVKISKALTDDFLQNSPDNEGLRKSILTFDQSGVLTGEAKKRAQELFKADFTA